MKNNMLIDPLEAPADVAQPDTRHCRSVHLHVGAHQHRPIRITFPARRHQDSLTRRDIIAALREAEFEHWQSSGGDFLSRAFPLTA